MTLVLSFNPQVESLVIHLSHELHDTTKSLESLTLQQFSLNGSFFTVSCLLTVLYFPDADD